MKLSELGSFMPKRGVVYFEGDCAFSERRYKGSLIVINVAYAVSEYICRLRFNQCNQAFSAFYASLDRDGRNDENLWGYFS